MTSSIRESALSFEAVKVAMRQTKDGVTITFTIHPNDDTNDLFIHPVGSRYQVALVLLGDDGKPIPPEHQSDKDRIVAEAGALCRNMEFVSWIRTYHPKVYSEETAAQWLRKTCGVTSRRQLATNEEARKIFEGIKLTFAKSREL